MELYREGKELLNKENYGINTCFDYVDDYGVDENGKSFVTVFIEPCGNVTFYGNDVEKISEYWNKVLLSQPEGMDYMEAGWLLDRMDGLSIDKMPPKKVWQSAVRKRNAGEMLYAAKGLLSIRRHFGRIRSIMYFHKHHGTY